MNDWFHVLDFEREMFTIHIDWTYEQMPVRDMFDDTVSDIDDMERRCDQGIDTHYMTRVTVFFEGLEIEELVVGSCYACDMHPDTDIMNEYESGYISDFVNEAFANAKEKCREMTSRFNEVFA